MNLSLSKTSISLVLKKKSDNIHMYIRLSEFRKIRITRNFAKFAFK